MAWKRVKANRGSAGVDGLTIQATADDLKTHWPRIREMLQNGSYVRSQKAGVRALNGLRKLYDRLHLKVNEAKSAVASAYGRAFLGYALWCSAGDMVKRGVAYKAMVTFKRCIQQITRRSCGRNMNEVAEELRRYVPGWKAYFKLAQTPKVFRQLDEWLRHRLRAVRLKHWRRGTTVYRELRALGASSDQAARVAPLRTANL